MFIWEIYNISQLVNSLKYKKEFPIWETYKSLNIAKNQNEYGTWIQFRKCRNL
jgi:hypothetical protein